MCADRTRNFWCCGGVHRQVREQRWHTFVVTLVCISTPLSFVYWRVFRLYLCLFHCICMPLSFVYMCFFRFLLCGSFICTPVSFSYLCVPLLFIYVCVSFVVMCPFHFFPLSLCLYLCFLVCTCVFCFYLCFSVFLSCVNV